MIFCPKHSQDNLDLKGCRRWPLFFVGQPSMLEVVGEKRASVSGTLSLRVGELTGDCKAERQEEREKLKEIIHGRDFSFA